ncbi:Uncharacterised protein [Salmonella enterica subsp. enterica serovar Typhimurium str. DT104]|nr:Uncharacterised protein [Salmonella enterica subsp. enterica serovar Typhimurium str. DT104]
MTKRNVIGTGNPPHITLSQGREEGHHQPQDQRSGEDQPYALKPRHGQDYANHTGHVKGVMPGQKDIFKTRKACHDNIGHHTKCHN